MPKFVKVLNLIIRENKEPFALVTTMATAKYDNHFHCYKIDEIVPGGQQLVVSLDLITEEPLWILKSFEDDSCQYVNPRHVL